MSQEGKASRLRATAPLPPRPEGRGFRAAAGVITRHDLRAGMRAINRERG